MWRLVIGMAIAVATASAAIAAEAGWPNRPITLIVPFAAGGGIDISARMQAQAIGEILGVSVVVENIGGGGGMTAGGAGRTCAPRRLHLHDRQFWDPRLQPNTLQEAAL